MTDGRLEFRKEFPSLFTGLKTTESHLKGIQSQSVLTRHGRFLTLCMEELDRMVEQSVISAVRDPTEWYSVMVPVLKSDGKLRVCVDLTELNQAVAREVHPMKDVDENLAKLQGSVIYSNLDTNSGFWQIPLHEKSRLLTTFITPQGRFCFNRLPFGISSAPEIFQRMIWKTKV